MRRVRFTAAARAHVEAEHSWWVENRDHTDILATDVERALQIVAAIPGVGTPYPSPHLQGVRRLYLRRIGCHLYYVFDDAEVLIVALWSARRRRGPTPVSGA